MREGEGRTDGERERASKERERAKDGDRSEERGASRRSRGGCLLYTSELPTIYSV